MRQRSRIVARGLAKVGEPLVILILIACLLAACGGDDPTATPVPPTTAPTVAPTTAPTATATPIVATGSATTTQPITTTAIATNTMVATATAQGLTQTATLTTGQALTTTSGLTSTATGPVTNTMVTTATQPLTSTTAPTTAQSLTTTKLITNTQLPTATAALTTTTEGISTTKAVTSVLALTTTGALTPGQKITTTTLNMDLPEIVLVGQQAKLGQILIDGKGMTLYIFDKDIIGKSNCTGNCLKNWPPLTVENEQAVVGGKLITGQLGTIKREDGAFQVTINAMPLYYYAKDKQFGDATGQGVGDSWWTVAPDGRKITQQ